MGVKFVCGMSTGALGVPLTRGKYWAAQGRANAVLSTTLAIKIGLAAAPGKYTVLSPQKK